jgi:nucleoside-diphosphate-sugar epimerase
MSGLHVVFGAGQVGPFVVDGLRVRGLPVRVVKRTATDLPEDVELRLGDAADPHFVRQACAGAAVVYHCMNPPYETKAWARLVPRYLDNLIEGAALAGARLVVLDNLYLLGPGDGRAIDEDTPIAPISEKGAIRARATDALFTAHARGTVPVVVGRASDFYGPRGTGTHFGEAFWRPALAGRTVRFLPRADTPHTYHYIPDVAAGLVELALADDDVLGRDWMLPCQPAESSVALVERLARALGQPIRLAPVGPLLGAALGLVMPVVRELREMRYQWEQPFAVNDARFRARFAYRPVERDTAATATVAWARSTYGP